MSKILDIAHDMAKDLFEVGAMDEVTMRTVESLCLPEKKVFLPEDIRRIRTTNHLSQPVFAHFDAQDWKNDRSAVGARGKKAWRSSLALIGCDRSKGYCGTELK